MNGRSSLSHRAGRRTRVIIQLIAVLVVALPAIDGTVGVGVQRASADPAPAATNVSQNTAGALTAGTVPDGTCFATVSASGGGGASSSTGGAITGGQGGAGAVIGATFRVVPGQSYGGTVGAGAPKPTGGAGATAPGGAGDGNGGAGGTIVTDHRGGGGGGGSSVSFAGTKVLVAGGGGGGGAAHQNTPAGLGGGAGFTGVGAGVVAPGSTGSVGVDNPNTITVGGGQGGQTAAGGTGGTNSSNATLNGAGGTGVGTGNGGNGGPDGDYDSGAGGGGGYTGGGGGASTANTSVTGGGGGGGSSWVRGTSVDAASTAPSSITGAAGTATASGSAAGATGSITITWVPCNYDLALTKTVSSPTVNAGNKVTWTVTVKNNGPYPMTKGDTVTLTDTLPAGPNGTPTPAYKVTSFTDTPGTSGGLASGALTCAGVTVGSAMPASTDCSRAYSAPSAVGAPSGGLRGLDVNEQITITYEQIISNTAPCATITNIATVKDRPSGSIVTDTASQALTINCYDLSITKTANAPDVTQGDTITWTIAVTNNGPADMAGPVDTTANPLVITDSFPGGGSVNGPVTSTQTGPAGPCSRSGSTITCTNGLASGATETLLFTQTVKNGAANGAVVNNTATVTDPKTGDTNDSSTGTTTVKNAPSLTLKKTVVARANAADQFTVSATHGAITDASATTAGAGGSATTAATNLTAGTTYTLSDAMAAGSVSVLGQYTKSIACTNSTAGSATTLPSGPGASFTLTPANGDVITCTFSNGPTTPTITFTKSISSRFAASDQFTAQIKNGAAVTASATTAGAGTTASTPTTAVTAGTTYTLTEIMAGGTSALSDYTSSIACTNSTPGTPTTLPSGAGQSFSVTPAAGDAITCTLTNAAKPHVTLVKSVAGRVAAADQFTVAITHGAGPTTDASATTSGAGVSATTGSQNLVAGTTYTLTDAMAAGSTSTLSDYLSSISCTNATGGSVTTLPSGSGTSFSVTPAAADNITCTITNTAKPHVTLIKSVASRANAADQFTVAIKNGAATVASATTSGAGVSASTGSQTLTAATTYTLTDATAAGSASVIGQYASSVSCTNTNGSSGTTLPSGIGTSFSLTPASGDTITCTITNTAGTATLGLTKNASPSTGVTVGTVITYTYGVTNTGSLPLTNVTVTDPHPGLSAISCAPAPGSTLAAGATMSCSATYTVTQADVDAGSILNTGTVTAKDPSDNTVSKAAGKTVTATQAASLSLTKSALPNSGVVAGNVVTYTFSGQNTGSVTLHNVTVTDPMPGLSAVNCSPGTPATLAPNATISCTATYTVTQANVDAGSFSNTATIAGLDPSNNPVSGSGGTSVSTLRVGTLALTKSASPDTGVVAGDVITYTFSGQNTGTVTLHNVNVTDPMPGLSAVNCTPGTPATLAPSATFSCTATYTVTQADVDAGSFSNTATVSGLEPTNAPVTKSAGATVTANQVPSVDLAKNATPASGVVAGDVVTYTFYGTNTGTVTLHNVTVSDPMAGLSAIGCTPTAPANLAPGASIDCSATYTVTQADVDAGSFSNTATVDALDPADAPVTDTANATVTATQNPGLTAAKTASPDTGVVAGDVITYTVTGTNSGNVTLSNATVTDPLPGLSAFSCTPAEPASLAPGDSITCTATYTVTQGDVDAGGITNIATVHASFGSTVLDEPAAATVTVDQQPGLTVTKTANPPNGVTVGDPVTYTVLVENTGTVSIDAIGVTDPMAGLSAFSCTPAAPSYLAPGESMSCTADYTVTQGDVDAGQIDNTATASGTDPNNNPVTASGSATVITQHSPGVSITKTATPDVGVVAGDIVTYSFHGVNTGNVTLHGVEITDPMTGLSAVNCLPVAPATLAPGDAVDCTATYTVTQADVDAGSFSNTATISGAEPNNDPVSASAGALVSAFQYPNYLVTKTASPDSGVLAGDVVTYTVTATNSGTVTLTDMTVADPMPGLSPMSCAPTTPTSLAPGDSLVCTATYTVTQADVDAGSISNTATVYTSNSAQNANATVTTGGTDDLTLTKSAAPDSGVVAGDIVTYSFHGVNSGTVSVHDVSLSDPLPGLSALSCSPSAPATLAPGDAIDCTATYTVTQADVDAGTFTNTATMSGLNPADDPVQTTASAPVSALQVPDVGLTKSGTPATGVLAGDTVTFTISATNTGTVSLFDIDVQDTLAGLSALSCSPSLPATLAPGDTLDCTATYTATQADVDNGFIDNTATLYASGATAGYPVQDTAGATVETGGTASLSFTKTASPTSNVQVGDVITYTFTGTNTGSVTVHNVAVSDPMSGLSAIACTPAAPAGLAPGATIDCSATYTVTQADVDAGSISNTATIDGLDPSDHPVSATGGTTVTAHQVESLTLVKTASPDQHVAAGDVVTYTMVATNDGTVTIDHATITDTMAGLSPLTCTPGQDVTLAPGASMTCTATYTVTPTDVARGAIDNVATVTGDGITGHPASSSSSAIVPTAGSADVTLAKKLEGVSDGAATWRITVSNSGTADLPGPFTVTDALPDGLTYVSAAGEGWACTGTTTIRCTHAGDLAAGTATSITVVTTVTGTGTITNVASMDVLGKTVSSDAVYTPTDPSGFAFTGAEAQRYGLIGLLLVVGGWLLLGAVRKRDEEPIVES